MYIDSASPKFSAPPCFARRGGRSCRPGSPGTLARLRRRLSEFPPRPPPARSGRCPPGFGRTRRAGQPFAAGGLDRAGGGREKLDPVSLASGAGAHGPARTWRSGTGGATPRIGHGGARPGPCLLLDPLAGPADAPRGRQEKKVPGGVDARSERPIIPVRWRWRAPEGRLLQHRSLTIRSGSLCGRSRRRSVSRNRRRRATRHAVACTSVESESGHVRVVVDLQLKSLILAQIERWRHA